MKVAVFTSFDEIPAELVALSSYPQQADFLLSLDWFQCLFANTADSNYEPRIYFVTDSMSLPVLALFCQQRVGCNELHSLTNFYTTSYAPIEFRSEADTSAAYQALASFLASERPKWVKIDLRLLPAAVDDNHPLWTNLAREGFFVYRFAEYENWFLMTENREFDDYYSTLSSRTRNTIKRKENKTRRSHEVDIRIIADVESDLDAAIRDYVGVYEKSWKVSEPYVRFIPSLAGLCAKHGILRLGIMTLDGQPVAAQFWIVTPATALIYKLAYDESFASMSPGSILSRAIFANTMGNDRPREIDYGVGSEPYKKEWMNSMRKLYGLQAINRKTFAGNMYVIRKIVLSAVKSILRRQ